MVVVEVVGIGLGWVRGGGDWWWWWWWQCQFHLAWFVTCLPI